MQWRDLNVLWLLTLVVALGAVLLHGLRRRRVALTAFAEAGLVDRLVAGLETRRRAARMVLRAAAMAALVVAIAGPRWGFHWEEVHREGIDLVIALDTSRSMLATDVKPDRLERAKLAVLDLVERLRGDRIALVAFAGTAFLECPLTLDYGAFERTLRATHVGIIPRGGTALARAIDTSLDAFEARQGKHEALVLITDGEDHEGDVMEAAERAAARGVKVYTVGIGTADGELVPAGEGGREGFVKDREGQVIKSRLDEDTLEQIALTTSGAYVRGLGPALGLDEVFDKHIAKLERRDVGSTLERRYEKRFQIPLTITLVLLLVDALLGVGAGAGPGLLRRVVTAVRTRRPGATAAVLVMVTGAALVVAPRASLADVVVEANRLYDEQKYDEAIEKYREALVDEPDSLIMSYNLGTALYRRGKFDEAVGAFTKVAASGEDEWTARAAYNLGNTLYSLGDNAEDGDPQTAIASYQQALLAYRRAMAVAPGDDDPKYGHEFVTRALADLERRLEEEQQEQEDQQEQEQDPQQQDQEQPPEDQQQGDQGDEGQQDEQAGNEEPPQNPDGPEPDAEQEQQQQQAGGEQDQQQPPEPEQQAGGGEPEPQQAGVEQQPPAEAGGSAGEGSPEEQREREAAQAILDLAGSEELGPEEIERTLGVAGVGEPVKDW